MGGVTGCKDASASASSLRRALIRIQVTVAIQADLSVFQQYTGGVITPGCGSRLVHNVLAVGYDGNTTEASCGLGALAAFDR